MRFGYCALSALSAAALVAMAGGCVSDEDLRAANRAGDRFIVPDRGGFEARLAAAKTIESDSLATAELENTAFLSARANYADVALGALKSLPASQRRDDLASRVALQLNQHHRWPAAIDAARMIDSDSLRDRTLRDIGMLPMADLNRS
jgi:hypothetical protein